MEAETPDTVVAIVCTSKGCGSCTRFVDQGVYDTVKSIYEGRGVDVTNIEAPNTDDAFKGETDFMFLRHVTYFPCIIYIPKKVLLAHKDMKEVDLLKRVAISLGTVTPTNREPFKIDRTKSRLYLDSNAYVTALDEYILSTAYLNRPRPASTARVIPTQRPVFRR